MTTVSVTVKIRNTDYPLACNVGQEALLQSMAALFDKRVGALSDSVGKGSDIRLLLIAALQMEAELQELKGKLAAYGLEVANNANNPAEEVNILTARLEKVALELNRV